MREILEVPIEILKALSCITNFIIASNLMIVSIIFIFFINPLIKATIYFFTTAAVMIILTLISSIVSNIAESIVSKIKSFCISTLYKYKSKELCIFSLRGYLKFFCCIVAKLFSKLNWIGNQRLKNGIKLASFLILFYYGSIFFLFIVLINFTCFLIGLSIVFLILAIIFLMLYPEKILDMLNLIDKIGMFVLNVA